MHVGMVHGWCMDILNAGQEHGGTAYACIRVLLSYHLGLLFQDVLYFHLGWLIRELGCSSTDTVCMLRGCMHRDAVRMVQALCSELPQHFRTR